MIAAAAVLAAALACVLIVAEMDRVRRATEHSTWPPSMFGEPLGRFLRAQVSVEGITAGDVWEHVDDGHAIIVTRVDAPFEVRWASSARKPGSGTMFASHLRARYVPVLTAAELRA